MLVAIITGGASGLGLAVAKALTEPRRREEWSVHLLDVNQKRGNEAAQTIGATFHRTDVANYSSLADSFHTVFKSHQRLDFVFANAGIGGDPSYYYAHRCEEQDLPPPEPRSLRLVSEVNLHSVMTTSYLAQHYFRRCPIDDKSPRSLILTASSGALYPVPNSPVYGAAKHGVVGWCRSIAQRSWDDDKVRVNAICPGVVRTNLAHPKWFDTFPETHFTRIDKVVEVVLMLLSGEAAQLLDVPLVGQTVEISGNNHYFVQQKDFCDDTMKAVTGTLGPSPVTAARLKL